MVNHSSLLILIFKVTLHIHHVNLVIYMYVTTNLFRISLELPSTGPRKASYETDTKLEIKGELYWFFANLNHADAITKGDFLTCKRNLHCCLHQVGLIIGPIREVQYAALLIICITGHWRTLYIYSTSLAVMAVHFIWFYSLNIGILIVVYQRMCFTW